MEGTVYDSSILDFLSGDTVTSYILAHSQFIFIRSSPSLPHLARFCLCRFVCFTSFIHSNGPVGCRCGQAANCRSAQAVNMFAPAANMLGLAARRYELAAHMW